MSDMGWTDERLERLPLLLRDGNSAAQIARQLGGGLTRNAVIGKVHRLGLKLPRAEPSDGVRRVPLPRLVRKPRAVKLKKAAARDAIAAPPIGPVGDFPVGDRASEPKYCRHIAGDPAEHDDAGRPTFQCCGHPVFFPGSPWCEAHYAKMHQPGTSRYDRPLRSDQRYYPRTKSDDDEAA